VSPGHFLESDRISR